MNISMLGAKVIGSTLARKWVAAGHRIKFGVRNVSSPDVQSLVQELGDRATAGSIQDAIALGQVVVFAIPGHAMEETIRAHAHLLNGRIVIDASNNAGGPVMNSTGAITRHAPEAKVFRAFNSLGWENFENPRFGETVADLFYCGAADDSRSVVEKLIEDVGLRPIRLGDLDKVHLVDAVAAIWFALAFGQTMGRQLAFKVLTR
jgi:hypothetical protein